MNCGQEEEGCQEVGQEEGEEEEEVAFASQQALRPAVFFRHDEKEP
jgi:hypothetical protein